MFNGIEIQFIGHLTRNPELCDLPSGNVVCNLSLTVNSVANGADGERPARTDYVRVTLWGKAAENANQYLVKGLEAICRGRQADFDQSVRLAVAGAGALTLPSRPAPPRRL